jgi:alpha-N-acetylglucosamine transferase
MDEKIIEQIKKIKLRCNENEDFSKVPDDMINQDGTKNYAYVTLIMLGDKYIPGAIVLADSIRKLGSSADLVVMITHDVSQEGEEILKIFFDHVIKVDYINVENWRTKIQKHRAYLDLVFTKFQVYNLVQYKKILLIDADAIILNYPDHLFTLKTPAGVYLPNKDEIISYDEKGEYVYDKKIEWFENYCSCCSHGKLIPKHITDRIKEGCNKNKNNNSGISGGLILLEPNKEEFNMILKDIRSPQTFQIIKNKLIWPEQQYLGMRYSGFWTSIEPIFLGLQGFPHWSVLFGLQFAGDKPFVLESKMSIQERLKYDDFQLWYKFYKEIINKYPELIKSKVLTEPNEMSKYFIVPLSRKSFEFKKLLSNGIINSVSKIFKIKPPQNYYFYHINISKEYNNDTINYLSEDDFIQNMILEIIRKYNVAYWKNIYNKLFLQEKLIDNLNSNKININSIKNLDIIDRENILSHYAKINSNVSIILVITTSETEKNFWLDNNLVSNILYEKNIDVNGNVLKNIIFNIEQTYSYDEREKNLNLLFSDVKDYKIKLLLYKTVIESNLKGNNKDIYVLSDNLSKVRTLSILLNDNTLNKFKNREICFTFNNNKLLKKVVKSKYYTTNMLIFQSLKKWIYNNYDGTEIDNLMVISEFNINQSQDINKIIFLDTNVYLKDDNYIYKNYNKNKLFFMEIIFVNSSSQKSNLYKKHRDIIEKIHDQRYYYQLDGIKFYIQ